MPTSVMPSAVEVLRFLPELILGVVATLIMVLSPVSKQRHTLGILAVLGLIGAIVASLYASTMPGPAFRGMLVVDGFATFFRLIVFSVGILTALTSYEYLQREGAETGEYYALLLFSVLGQGVMVTSNELIMIFIGLEISSIASYVLAGYMKDDRRSNEAALKYFLLGSFATAFLLYGIAVIYGGTGATNLSEIRTALNNPQTAPTALLVATSASLMFIGFAFKVSAAPFQIWAPDVYQGAPAPVSAFLSAGPKAAGFAIFLRVYLTAFEPIADRWEPIVWWCALLTMTIGNFAALTQTNVKRLLAYSSIAHAGYVLVALCARSEIGTAAAMFYLAAYAFMNIGAFGVVSHLARKGEKFVNVDDLAGLGTKQPMTAALLTVFLLSLIGVPLTGGFFGKFYIFKAALDSNLVGLTILGLLNSAVAAFYYLRLLVVMYMNEPGEATEGVAPLSGSLRLVLVVSALGTLVLGIFPSFILNYADQSAILTR